MTAGLQLVASRTMETAYLTQVLAIPPLHPSVDAELLGVRRPPCARNGGRCHPFCTLSLTLGVPVGAAWPLFHARSSGDSEAGSCFPQRQLCSYSVLGQGARSPCPRGAGS